MNITDLKIGDHAKVIGFKAGEKIYRHKLLAMGLTPNTEFTVTRVAPLGDPIELQVRDFFLSLRKAEACNLDIEKVTHDPS